MSRNLSASMQTALRETVARPIYFAELEFTSGPLYLSSLTYNLDWAGVTWLGDGTLISPGSVVENIEQRANGAVVVLSAEDSAVISLVLGDTNQNCVGRLYIGLFATDWTLIEDPTEIFGGYFDSATIKDSGGERIVELAYENEYLGQRKINERRYTHYSQQAYFPGDKGFIFTPTAAKWRGFWGKAERPNFIKKRRTARN